MKNKQLLEGALASIKTVRKNLGGVTLIGQSAEDLGANADSIVNSCTSFLFFERRDVQPKAVCRALQDE
jgi:type IV secretion system protein VirB4